jgi:aminopeptidase-like protein
VLADPGQSRAIEAAGPAAGDIGAELFDLAKAIFPLCRSITGEGVRETIRILSRHLPIEPREVATNTPAFDWTVPREWVVRDAYIEDSAGRRIVDFRKSNLSVLNYSAPVNAIVSLTELKEHVFTLPEQPDLIPYRTSYYSERWGFCMPHRLLCSLPEGSYHVVIDSELKDGSLTYGEYFHRGASEREFLFTTHICHPSLANDNCSGLALLTLLARDLRSRRSRLSYRFLFIPGTIGSLSWLAANEERLHLIDHGLVVSCVGDGGGPTYKRSRRGSAFIDRAVANVVGKQPGDTARVLDFSPYGYDERQFCSPGFNLPVGLFQRSAFGTFPEYHTSADNLDFIRPEHLAASYRMLMDVIDIVEEDWTPLNLCPKGEPQLGRRGLYAALGGDKSTGERAMAMLWVLNLADGTNSLLAIAERSGLPFADIAATARLLRDHGLLAEAQPAP